MSPPAEAEQAWPVDEERKAIEDEGCGQLAANDGSPPRRRKLDYLTGADIAKPLPPTEWICRELQLAPGRPILFTAAAGTGKTWVLLSLLLTVAAGRSSWLERYSLQRTGPVLHLNADMGERALRRRYQRLARGMRLSLEEMDKSVFLFNSRQLPDGFSLLGDGAEPFLVSAIEETKACLVLIDALRPLLGGADENKSEASEALRVLLRVSERTGATVAVIHHQGKPGKEEGGARSSQHKARGSSAFVDACDATFSLEPAGFPDGICITQGKASMGQKNEPLFVRLADVGEPGDDGARSGFVVLDVHPDEAAQLVAQQPQAVNKYADDILRVLGERGELKRSTITEPGIVRGNKQGKTDALRKLEADGKIVNERGLIRLATFPNVPDRSENGGAGDEQAA